MDKIKALLSTKNDKQSLSEGKINYAYDALNRLVTLTDSAGGSFDFA